MNINEIHPSKYLKASEIGKRPKRFIMEAVDLESIGDDKKAILFFKGEPKGLVLNKTNSNAIAYLYGPETDDWIGQPILLYSTMVDYQGKPVEAIRTMPPEIDERPIQREEPRRPISQQAAPPRSLEVRRPARHFNDAPADDFPGDRPPLEAYDEA